MKTKETDRFRAYAAPELNQFDILVEGMLCSSATSEAYGEEEQFAGKDLWN